MKFSRTQLSNMIQLGIFTKSPGTEEGSLFDLFLTELTKKKHINSKEDLKHVAVDPEKLSNIGD